MKRNMVQTRKDGGWSVQQSKDEQISQLVVLYCSNSTAHGITSVSQCVAVVVTHFHTDSVLAD